MLIGLFVSRSTANALSLFVGYGAPFNEAPVAELAALGHFAAFTQFNLTSGTPTLTQLQGYDAVLIFTDYPPQNPVALGDVLADLVDSGGHLVVGTYSLSSPWAITGRITTTGYLPLVNQLTNGDVSGQFRAVVPGDPVFLVPNVITPAAVAYFHNGNFAHPGLDAGAIVLADDNAGIPLFAVNAGGSVGALNMFAAGGSFGGNNSEFYQFLDNALFRVTNCDNGIVDAGEQCDDGNTVSGDGCSACTVDACYTCAGSPSVCTPTPDGDGDGVCDAVDNCPTVANPTQTDTCHLGLGDACSPDADADGVPDACDNCPTLANPDSQDNLAACIALSPATATCSESDIALVGTTVVEGAVTVEASFPPPTSIVFEILNTDCGATPVGFEVFLNGVSLGTGDPDPTNGCTCAAGITTFSGTDSALIASAWGPGVNALRYYMPDDGSHHLAWVRATLDFGTSSETSCLYGDCSIAVLCSNPLAPFVDATKSFEFFSPLVTVGYANSQLPEQIDISGLDDGEYRLCVSATEMLPPPSTVTFAKLDSDPDDGSVRDEISANLLITRASNRGVYNLGADATEWAVGTCAVPASAFESDFNAFLRNHFRYPVNVNLPGSDTCVHDITTNAYYDIHWNSWSCCNQGGFSYQRVGPVLGPKSTQKDCLTFTKAGQDQIVINGRCIKPPQPPDHDRDGLLDAIDNCPNNPNPDQRDSDGDGVGDACDNCASDFNAFQTNVCNRSADVSAQGSTAALTLQRVRLRAAPVGTVVVKGTLDTTVYGGFNAFVKALRTRLPADTRTASKNLRQGSAFAFNLTGAGLAAPGQTLWFPPCVSVAGCLGTNGESASFVRKGATDLVNVSLTAQGLGFPPPLTSAGVTVALSLGGADEVDQGSCRSLLRGKLATCR